jgi:hypothetical protein
MLHVYLYDRKVYSADIVDDVDGIAMVHLTGQHKV